MVPQLEDDLAVELYAGKIDPRGEFVGATATPMIAVGWDGGPRCAFVTDAMPGRTSGLYGYTVRVLPDHPDLSPRFLPGLISWADPQAAPVGAAVRV